LVDRVETVSRDEALGETQRHRRVVGPLTRTEMEWAATDHVEQGRKSTWGLEFQRGAERVAGSQPKQAPSIAVARGHCGTLSIDFVS
jgi:hypothetical protein